jgi:CubicO group peptidase (beta-lactamase class C family)
VTIARTVEPAEVGLDPKRLANLDNHFARYVDTGLLAGWQIVVTRRGEVAHASTYGQRDLEEGAAVTPDTLWRIYSMTKPVTSVAAMTLWEEGRFELTDEISRWIPEFADVRVWDKGSALRPYTVPAAEPIRMWHLLTHTSGLTYGFMQSHPVDALYRAAGYDLASNAPGDLAATTRNWAKLPLLHQPGARWSYSVSTAVLGRVLEVITGQTLDEVIAERILTPLKMTDTRWWVDTEDANRMAALYVANPANGKALRYDLIGAGAFKKPEMLGGGEGLISSAADYHRFTQMLLNEGELDGVRLLSSRTVRYMTRNHLPGGQTLGDLSSGGFAETTFDGVGFGLGFAVLLDPAVAKVMGTEGLYYWGGAASTTFWVDPREELVVLLLTQLLPSSAYPIRRQMKALTYQALID